MKEKNLLKKEVTRTVVSACAVIGTCTMLFNTLSQSAIASEISKTKVVPTSYNVTIGKSDQSSLPTGYQKGNYKVKTNSLEYYQKSKPTSKDISREEAAELGVQAIWEIFQKDMEGKTIEMGYNQPTDTFPRSTWSGSVKINENLSYFFSLDSLTGERFSVGKSRKLKEKVSVGFDMKLNKDASEYETLAKKTCEKYNVVHGKIESSVYNGQGYSENDPSISVDVTGKNGEIALICYSRYDKELLSIGYDASYKISKAAHEKFVKETEKKAKEARESKGADHVGEPNLIELK